MASRSGLGERVAGLVQRPFLDGRSLRVRAEITTLLKRHYEHGRVKMLAVARKIATPAQRQTLPINARVSNVFGADSSRNCAVKGGGRGYYGSIHPTTDNVPKMRN